MRLPPFAGRVKFRPVQSFRVHDPALVERLPAGSVGPASQVY
jgi:hypothetical protein